MILKINDKKYDFFTKIDVNLTYNAIASTFGFSAFFEPTDPAHKALFRPLRYSKVTIENEGETLITGRILSSGFKSDAAPQLATISGYSLTGVFEDSAIPISVYPLQTDGLSLKEITEKIIEPFDIALVIDPAVQAKANEAIEKSDAKVGGTVKSYINQLASERDILVTHTSGGALLFTEAKANNQPIADLSDAVGKTLTANGQGLHSSIAVLKEADLNGGNAGEVELDNPIIHSFRPRVVTQTSGDDNDTELAGKNARAAELAGIKLNITLDSWLVNDRTIKPNQIITVKDPEVFLYKKTSWFIQNVKLSGTVEKQVANLTCVLPETYNGKTPSSPFS